MFRITSIDDSSPCHILGQPSTFLSVYRFHFFPRDFQLSRCSPRSLFSLFSFNYSISTYALNVWGIWNFQMCTAHDFHKKTTHQHTWCLVQKLWLFFNTLTLMKLNVNIDHCITSDTMYALIFMRENGEEIK